MLNHEHTWDVLLTNASTRIAYSILRSLGERGLKVGLGVDSHSGMARYSRRCAGAFRHPCAEENPEGFMAVVRAQLIARQPAVFMPTGEDLFVVAKYRDQLADLPVRIVAAPFETLRQLDNKHESVLLAQSLGLPTPATILPGSATEIEAFARAHAGPVVFKLLRSSGSRGVLVVPAENISQVCPAFLREHHCDFGDFIVQEYIDAPGYGVAMLLDHGEVKASFTHRRLRERSPDGGPSTLRTSIHLPILESLATRLLQQVGFHGIAMVEFKHDAVSGKTWFLEINPRWWGSLALAVQAGVDFPMLYYRMAMGKHYRRHPITGTE